MTTEPSQQADGRTPNGAHVQEQAAPEPIAGDSARASDVISATHPTQTVAAATICATAEEACAHPAHKTNGKASRSKGGAPVGNENRVDTGIRVWRTKGRLPRKFKRIRDDLLDDGDLIEAELLQEHGSISGWQQRLLGDYMRQEGVARLAERRLTERGDTMPDSDFRGMTAMLTSATEAATKILQKLGMDHDRGGNGRPGVNGHRRGPGIEELPPTLLAEVEADET